MSESTTTLIAARVRRSRPRSGLRGLWKSPFFDIAVLIIVTVSLMAVFPALFTQIDPRDCDLSKSRVGPEPGHIMGYDIQGCDYWSNIVHGARTSLEVGVFTAVITFIVALIAGSLAGYFGGVVDSVISWTSNVILGIPVGIASLVILYQFQSRTVWTIVFVLVLFSWAGTMRYMRSSVMQVRNLEYIQAARGLGVGPWRILGSHVIPNAVTPLIVMTTLSVGAGMAAEAGFSILGVGLKLPAYSWGIQIALASQDGNWQIAPLLMFFPALMLGLTTLAFVVLGESLRDALDPKARR
ncbi:ABC transporter permease [Microbacterium sp. NPDC056234]|uniref:ABC transporter permease n=1 Tax=Microbacterium sp. NPDC056234 TaxID=3345757 RepID=UPI0035D651BF